MSSMWRAAVILPVLLGASASGSAQYSPPYSAAPAYGYAPSQNIAGWISNWRTLRQSSNYRFADYAGFLIANPDWPDAPKMRAWAEKAMQPGENGATVIAFFARTKPDSGNGWARLADAYAASARMTEALDAARNAWAEPDLGASDEQAIWARYGASLTRADHDRRVDALLFAKNADDAARFVPMATPQRQAAFGARVAMQRNADDAESRYQSVIGTVSGDAGLMMDRARYLRARGYDESARQLAARSHNFNYRPADPERFYEMLVQLANDAAQDRQWQTAFNIASQIDDVLPAGQSVADQPIGVRDDYTTLAWLAGNVALDRMQRPTSAIAMFDRYARAGRSLQVQTKGYYWAGRAALAAGQFQSANAYFERAAAYTDLFYGQLALERLGRNVTPPPAALPQYTTTAAQRATFNSRPSSRRRAFSDSRAARPSRRCSSGLWPNRSTMTSTATSRWISASSSGGRTSRCGRRGWRASRARCSTSARLTPPCPGPCRRACGHWPMASAARKARSTLMQSAMPARAA